MINLIIKLAVKFKAIDSFLDKLLFAYSISKNKQVDKVDLVSIANNEIRQIAEYEKYGASSGHKAPRIVGIGR